MITTLHQGAGFCRDGDELGRAYARTSARVLFWSAACFALLAGNNALVLIDLVLLPDADLILLRHLLSLSAVATLIFGFVWDLKE